MKKLILLIALLLAMLTLQGQPYHMINQKQQFVVLYHHGKNIIDTPIRDMRALTVSDSNSVSIYYLDTVDCRVQAFVYVPTTESEFNNTMKELRSGQYKQISDKKFYNMAQQFIVSVSWIDEIMAWAFIYKKPEE